MSGRIENEMKIEKSINNILTKMPHYVSDWFYYLKSSGRTISSCRDFIYKIKRYLIYANNGLSNIKELDTNVLTNNSVMRYLMFIQKKTVDENGEKKVVYTSDSYRQCVWSCMNNFFEFMKENNYVENNPLKLTNRPKNNDLEKINAKRILLTKEDFKKIIAAIESGSGSSRAILAQRPYKTRDKAIVLLYMTTGMRKTALSEIDIDDIDFDEKTLKIIDKGNQFKIMKLDDIVIDAIKDWIGRRGTIMMGIKSNALFVSSKRNRLSGNAIYKIIDKFGQEALGYHISPHKLRAGYCSILYEEKGDIEFVRRAVGHKNISTTQRYIVTNNEEREEAAHLIGNFLN